MSGNTIGVLFKVTTWGESHGPATGAIVDGCPPRIDLSEADIQRELDRRRPGTLSSSSPRQEADRIEILSGVFEGKTTGTPISLLIRNLDAQSDAYESLRDLYRPGHGDITYQAKYGIRDHRGGGRASARETAGRVAAGAVARKVIAQTGMTVQAWTKELGGITAFPHC
jgi:chorismate synthase